MLKAISTLPRSRCFDGKYLRQFVSNHPLTELKWVQLPLLFFAAECLCVAPPSPCKGRTINHALFGTGFLLYGTHLEVILASVCARNN
jgi:hypothetical protein